MAKYGIPYMGSKGPIIDKILTVIPPAENFYDLFGGGFSASHAALLAGEPLLGPKWKNIHYNEIKSDVVQLVRDAIKGKYNYDVFKPKWIDHDTFNKNKQFCAYTRVLWSFGNNQLDYIFGKPIEKYKCSLHQAVIFDEFNDIAKSVLGFDVWPVKDIKARRLLIRKIIRENNPGKERGRLQQLEQLHRLQQLEQLHRLQQLEQLQLTSLDYRDVIIKPNSVIYCDIPYRGTTCYNNNFDYDAFYAWAKSQSCPVFVSEYDFQVDGFKCILEIPKKQKLSQNSKSGTRREFLEKVYWNGL